VLESQVRGRAALPLGISLDLHSLCVYSQEHDQANEQGSGGDSCSSALIDLSQRHVRSAEHAAALGQPASTRVFELSCGLRGGVLHLQPLDVLRVNRGMLMAVHVNGQNAGSQTPVMVLRGPHMRMEDVSVSRCSVRVIGMGSHLVHCRVQDCDAMPAFHVARSSEAQPDDDEHVTLEDCEATESFVGLLVSGCPGPLYVRGGRCATFGYSGDATGGP
jgi:hypothetical protein